MNVLDIKMHGSKIKIVIFYFTMLIDLFLTFESPFDHCTIETLKVSRVTVTSRLSGIMVERG